jgi:hypothetical protein
MPREIRRSGGERRQPDPHHLQHLLNPANGYASAQGEELAGDSWRCVADQRPVVSSCSGYWRPRCWHTWMSSVPTAVVLSVTLFHGGLNTAATLLLPLSSGPAYDAVWWLAAPVGGGRGRSRRLAQWGLDESTA